MFFVAFASDEWLYGAEKRASRRALQFSWFSRGCIRGFDFMRGWPEGALERWIGGRSTSLGG